MSLFIIQMLRNGAPMIYLTAADPPAATRTWQTDKDTSVKLAPRRSKRRWASTVTGEACDGLCMRRLMEITSDRFLPVVKHRTVSAGVYPRRLQNLAVNLNWLPGPILNWKLIPEPVFKEKPAISQRNTSASRGASAFLDTGTATTTFDTRAAAGPTLRAQATSTDWVRRLLAYKRRKTGR